MDFPPIPREFIRQYWESDATDRLEGGAASDLQKLHDRTRDCAHKYSWGVNIYRTVYTPESDALFLSAVARIENYMKYGTLMDSYNRQLLTPQQSEARERAEKEITSRLVNSVVEDREVLENASMETVLAEFEKWVESHNCTKSYNTRYRIALVLDAQSIDNIMKLPETRDEKASRIEQCDILCKAVSRWGIDRDQPTPWLYVAPVAFTIFWFKLMEDEIDMHVYQAEKDPLVFIQKTMLYYRRRGVFGKLIKTEDKPNEEKE